MHSLLHDIPRLLILFLQELFLIFNQMLSIRAFGRRDIGDENIGDDDLFNLPVKLGELRVRLAP